MPKGRPGCWQCDEPAAVVVQAWLKDYVDGFYACARGPAGASRRMLSIDSVTRNLCRDHGLLLYARCAAELRGDHYIGCSICGESPTFSRIHVWARTTLPSTSLKSLSRGYCEQHSSDVYGSVAALLGADSYHSTGRHGGGTMAAARARRTRR